MDAATAVRTARTQARLSKRELARRAGTSPAAIVAYESGTREPTLPSLRRVVAAAGFDLDLVLRPQRPIDPQLAGERLLQVLELAEQLPRRPAPELLGFPPLR